MAVRRVNESNEEKPRQRPAATLEAREQQLVALAVDVAEEQMRQGTASAMVINHYLKLGSSRERLEQERLEQEVNLLRIKSDTIASQKRVEDLYAEALQAMRAYSGNPETETPEEYDD